LFNTAVIEAVSVTGYDLEAVPSSLHSINLFP